MSQSTDIDAIRKRYPWSRLATNLAQKLDHMSWGGQCLGRWCCPLNDREMLRLMIGREPAGTSGRLLWHGSLSVGKLDGSPGLIRKPEGDEIKAAVIKTAEVSMARLTVHMWSDDKLVYHMWEGED